MLFCTPQNILVFRVGIELGVTANNIPKADFAIALNRILTPPVPSTGMGRNLLQRFFKSFDENIRNTHCQC
jgi:hypothetical protein